MSTLFSFPPWTQKEPTEPGSYWMWSGSDDSAPIHVEVMWSTIDNRCFLPSGQWDWTRHQSMEELKGTWWQPILCPPLPNSDPSSQVVGAYVSWPTLDRAMCALEYQISMGNSSPFIKELGPCGTLLREALGKAQKALNEVREVLFAS